MCTTVDHCSQTLFYEPGFSRWQYPVSSSRDDPLPTKNPAQVRSSTPRASPPPPVKQQPPSAVEIAPGVWEKDDEIQYSPEWPPVQAYLSELRKARHMIPAPSQIIFALAALHVVHDPHDPAHWLIWDRSRYSDVGKKVDNVAFESPCQIRYPVVWHGHTDHKTIIMAIQEKFNYVYVQRKWYPIEYQLNENKRVLRSTAAEGSVETPRTINEYFNFVEAGSSTSSKQKKSPKDKSTSKKASAIHTRAARSAARPIPATPTEIDEENPSAASQSAPAVQDSPTRSTSRVHRKVSPEHHKSPRMISSPVQVGQQPLVASPEPLLPSDPTSPTSSPSSPSFTQSHAHLRSTSQSSAKTLVNDGPAEVEVHGRSTSVTSTDTAVAASPSRKRKAQEDDGEDEDDTKDRDTSSLAAGMNTRGRGRLYKAHQSPEKSRMSPPANDAQPSKSSIRPSKPKAKRARI
ncbi:hypothetical protein D9613_000787 [Agrocybe pediades]|uniref:Uncharacterized protein n=1 Tax=Agrocybe pediades TaxID=84607 RepID=A0A8H4R1Q0_9AGAR|nr:hypothetical protein D9613_000787 [Agrocybe pediades]